MHNLLLENESIAKRLFQPNKELKMRLATLGDTLSCHVRILCSPFNKRIGMQRKNERALNRASQRIFHKAKRNLFGWSCILQHVRMTGAVYNVPMYNASSYPCMIQCSFLQWTVTDRCIVPKKEKRHFGFICKKKIEKTIKLHEHPCSMSPSNIANFVRTLAGRKIDDGVLWHAVKRRILFLKPVLTPKLIAQIANGFARMRKVDHELFVELAEHAVQHAERFTSQQAALFLNALARLDLYYERLMEVFATQLIERDSKAVYEEQHLALIVNAYARLRAYKASVALFDTLAERICRQAAEFTPQGLANVVNAYYKTNHRDCRLMSALAPHVLRQLHQLEAQHVANLLQGYSWHVSILRATSEDDVTIVEHRNQHLNVCMALVDLIPRMKQRLSPMELTACARALAGLDLDRRAAVLTLSELTKEHQSLFQPQQLASMIYFLCKMKHFSTGVLRILAPSVSSRLSKFDDRSVVMLLHAYSKPHLQCSELLIQLASRLERSETLSQLPIPGVVTTLQALANMGVRTSLAEALLDRLVSYGSVGTAVETSAKASASCKATAKLPSHIYNDHKTASSFQQTNNAEPFAEFAESVPMVAYAASVLMSLLKLQAEDRTDVIEHYCGLLLKAPARALTPLQLTNIAYFFRHFRSKSRPLSLNDYWSSDRKYQGKDSLVFHNEQNIASKRDASAIVQPSPVKPLILYKPSSAYLEILLSHSLLLFKQFPTQLLASLSISFASLEEWMSCDATARWFKALEETLPYHLDKKISSQSAFEFLMAFASCKSLTMPSMRVLRPLASKIMQLLHKVDASSILKVLAATASLMRRLVSKTAQKPVNYHEFGNQTILDERQTIHQQQHLVLKQLMKSCERQLLDRMEHLDVPTLLSAAHMVTTVPVCLLDHENSFSYETETHYASVAWRGSHAVLPVSAVSSSRFYPQSLKLFMPFDLLTNQTVTLLAAHFLNIERQCRDVDEIRDYWRSYVSGTSLQPPIHCQTGDACTSNTMNVGVLAPQTHGRTDGINYSAAAPQPAKGSEYPVGKIFSSAAAAGLSAWLASPVREKPGSILGLAAERVAGHCVPRGDQRNSEQCRQGGSALDFILSELRNRNGLNPTESEKPAEVRRFLSILEEDFCARDKGTKISEDVSHAIDAKSILLRYSAAQEDLATSKILHGKTSVSPAIGCAADPMKNNLRVSSESSNISYQAHGNFCALVVKYMLRIIEQQNAILETVQLAAAMRSAPKAGK